MVFYTADFFQLLRFLFLFLRLKKRFITRHASPAATAAKLPDTVDPG
jgi:hypothetical protein